LDARISQEGEVKSAELIGQAITINPAFVAIRQIKAAREIAHTIASSNNNGVPGIQRPVASASTVQHRWQRQEMATVGCPGGRRVDVLFLG
jgi:hypothetical protein